MPRPSATAAAKYEAAIHDAHPDKTSLERYMALRIDGMSDARAIEVLTTSTRGAMETTGDLLDQVDEALRLQTLGRVALQPGQHELLTRARDIWSASLGSPGGTAMPERRVHSPREQPQPIPFEELLNLLNAYVPSIANGTAPMDSLENLLARLPLGTTGEELLAEYGWDGRRFPPRVMLPALRAQAQQIARGNQEPRGRPGGPTLGVATSDLPPRLAPPPGLGQGDGRGSMPLEAASARAQSVPTTAFGPADFLKRRPAGASSTGTSPAGGPEDFTRSLAATRYAGAYTGSPDGAPPVASGTEAALMSVAKELARRNKQEEDATSAVKGSLGSIGREEEQLVFLARACDRLSVTLCPHLVGRELFHGLRAAGENARPLFRRIQFPTNVTNLLAYGIASLRWGGRDHVSAPDYCITAACFPATSEEQFDSYRQAKDHKVETRPRHPATLSEWYRQALRESWAWSCVYGEEHYAGQEAAAAQLLALSERSSHAWPPHIVFGVWCELRGRWCEELRIIRQKMLHVIGDESVTFEKIRFVCTAPGGDGRPWLTLPATFDLSDPEQYFMTDVKVRHDRMLDRAAWSAAFGGPRKAGPGGGGGGGRVGAEKSREGTGGAGAPAGDNSAPKLLGPRLSRAENGRSMDRRPKSPGGRYICWSNACFIGCGVEGCPYSHKSIGNAASLDPTVVMQMIRRGGLKSSGKRITKDTEAEDLIKKIRDKRAAEDAGNRAPTGGGGGAGAGGGGRTPRGPRNQRSAGESSVAALASAAPSGAAGEDGGRQAGEVDEAPQWTEMPQEWTAFRTTDLEEDLRQLRMGPDSRWQRDAHPPPQRRTSPRIPRLWRPAWPP